MNPITQEEIDQVRTERNKKNAAELRQAILDTFGLDVECKGNSANIYGRDISLSANGNLKVWHPGYGGMDLAIGDREHAVVILSY